MFDMRYFSQQMKSKGINPLEEYLNSPAGTYNPYPEFDENYVVEQLNEANIKFQNALCAFLTVNDASINPSRDFDMHAYTTQNPDTIHYNAAYHYAIAGKIERRPIYKASSSLRDLEDQIAVAADIDIDTIPPNTDIVALDRVLSIDSARASASLLRTLKGSTKYKEVCKIFFVPHFEIGGAEKVLVNVVNAMLTLSRDEKILVIATDSRSESAVNWLPRSKNVFFCNISTYLSHMSDAQFLCVIGVYLQISGCKDIYVINSSVGWNLIEKYGKAISNIIKCHAFVFCYDYDQYGRRSGYAWTHLSHCLENLEYVFTDNKITPKVISNDLRLSMDSSKKFVTLYQPVDRSGESTETTILLNKEDRKFKKRNILWASRFHRQKNLRLALEIAALMPEYDFTFAGGFSDDNSINGVKITENVSFVGPYDGFEALFTENVSLFLYTSNWDGLPNILLEVGSIGIPIVARDTGGISDLVDHDTGWLIRSDATPLDFSTCIRSIFSESAEIPRKVANMKAKIIDRHGWQRFVSEVQKHFYQCSEEA